MVEEGVQKNEWSAFVASQEHSPFLQSYEWGEFQKALGFQSDYYVIRDHAKNIQAGARIVALPLTEKLKYWYCPGGFVGTDSACLNTVSEYVIKKAQRLGIPFVRYDVLHSSFGSIIKGSSKTLDAYPKCTRILDCSQSSEDLFKKFHEKTRYNIRLSQKREIRVKVIDTKSSVCENSQKEAYALLQQTGDRHAVRAYPRHHFDALWHLPSVLWYGAYKNETLVAVQAVVFFGDTALYLHGGSAYEYRSDMAPYALQWSVIQDVCKKKFHYYDLWGIALPQDKKHSLAGVSKFKEGFGGMVYCGKGTFDVIHKRWLYTIYKSVRFFRRGFKKA